MKYFTTLLEALDYIADYTQYTQLCYARTGETVTTDIPQYRTLRASIGGLSPCAIAGDKLYLTMGILNVRPLSKPTYVLV